MYHHTPAVHKTSIGYATQAAEPDFSVSQGLESSTKQCQTRDSRLPKVALASRNSKAANAVAARFLDYWHWGDVRDPQLSTTTQLSKT